MSLVEEARQILLHQAVLLQKAHNAKVAAWQQEEKLSPEVATVTREALQLMRILPELQRHGITLDQVDQLAKETT